MPNFLAFSVYLGNIMSRAIFFENLSIEEQDKINLMQDIMGKDFNDCNNCCVENEECKNATFIRKDFYYICATWKQK
jgi:hypothetical protein